MASKRKLDPDLSDSNKKAAHSPKPTNSKKKASSNRLFQSRMTPKLLFNFVSSPLSSKQITDIKDIGFGGLLLLKTDYVPGNLAHWLCTNLDVPKSSLMDGKLRITDSDIYFTTGLPMGAIPIIESKVREKSDDRKKMISEWKKQFGDTCEEVTKSMIYNKMLQQVDGGDDFKRNFVVFVVATFLNGVTGVKPSLRILDCLKDVSQIPNFNWCLYTLKNLLEHVKEWKANQEKGTPTAFKGPIIILIIIYLDRVCFKFRNEPRTFPTLSSWTTDLIRQRILLELKEGRDFGQGSVDPPLDHPLPLKAREATVKPLVLAAEKVGDTNIKEKDVVLQELVGAAGVFYTSLDHFLSAISKAELVLPRVNVMEKMTALGDGLISVTKLVLPTEETEVKDGKKIAPTDGNETTPKQPKMNVDFKQPIPIVDDPFFSRPDVLEHLNRLEKMWDRFSKVHHGPNAFNRGIRFCDKVEGRVDSQENEMPSFKLFSSQDFMPTSPAKNPLEEIIRSDDGTNVVVPITEDTPIVEQSTSEVTHIVEQPASEATRIVEKPASKDTPIVQQPTSETNIEQPTSGTNIEQPPPGTDMDVPILISPTVATEVNISGSNKEAPIIISPTILCTPPSSVPSSAKDLDEQPPRPTRRNTNPSCWYRSPFLVRNADVLANLTQAEKDLSDFAFAELDDSEVLYVSDTYTLFRFHMKSLMFGQRVDEEVVGAWCDVLNHQEKFRDSGSPLRLFLANRTYIDPRSFDFEGLSLVFVPVVDPTPLLFVVKLRSATIEVVYPMKNADYIPCFQDFIDLVALRLGKKIPQALELSTFKIQHFIPKSNIGCRVDCGIYLMRHMETYQGRRAGYKSSLTDDTCLKRLSVKYCHVILTFDQNDCKQKLCEASRTFKMRISTEDVDKEMPYTDKYLRDFVFAKGKALSEVLVDTEWMQVTRDGLRTLEPGIWIMDMVIDAVGIKATLGKDKLVYFPTTIKFLNPAGKRNTIQNQYIKTHFMPKTADKVQRVFFPILINNHWFACVADIKSKKCYILDSNENRRNTQRVNYASAIVNNAVDVVCKQPGYESFSSIKTFAFVSKVVPQQTNGYDCGVFVMRWLEALDKEELWNDEGYLANLDDFRESLLMGLLRWDKNKRKVFV